VDRLALAARCTAGFPVAFEPTFVPAGAPPLSEPDRLRPDMRPCIEWDDAGDGDLSRFAIDGGVLANMPTQPALRAIAAMPADDPVRRVVLLVHPHAPTPEDPAPDTVESPPTVTRTMGSLMGALTAQGSRSYVEALDEHNRLASSRRGTRLDVLATVQDGETLAEVAQGLFPHYQKLRQRRSARNLSEWTQPITGWSPERIRVAAAEGDQAWRSNPHNPRPDCPYVPSSWRVPALDASSWAWGATGALGIVEGATDLLRRLSWVVSDKTSFQVVADARTDVSTQREEIHAARASIDALWDQEPARSLAATPDYWQARLARYQAAMLGVVLDVDDAAAVAREVTQDESFQATLIQAIRLTSTGAQRDTAAQDPAAQAGKNTAHAVAQVCQAVWRCLPFLDVLNDLNDGRIDLAELTAWHAILPNGSSASDVLKQLLGLHVATFVIADETPTEATLPVDYAQLSLQVNNPFTRYTRSGDDKLGGMSVNRFGGFLKRSWRINDWIWGRLDAATLLAQIVLDPHRLRRVAVLQAASEPEQQDDANRPEQQESAEQQAKERATVLVSDYADALFGTSGAARDELQPWIDKALLEAERELYKVFLPATVRVDVPASLPATSALLAWALHLRIIAEELPELADAISLDIGTGSNQRSHGALFFSQHEQLINDLRDLRSQEAAALGDGATQPDEQSLALGLQALQAFDRAGIGREPMTDEASSDQLIRTSATAAAVAASLADGDRSGLTAAKPLTRALRGGMMLPYWTIYGLTSGNSIAKTLALGGLAVGGILLALSLFSVIGAWGTLVGAGVLLATFGYAAMRSGTVLHGLVLLTPVVPLIYLGLTGQDLGDSSELVVVLALVAGPILLGRLSGPPRSPLAAWAARSRWLRHLPGVVAGALLGIGFGALAAWAPFSLTSPKGWLLAAIVVVAVMVGEWQALRAGDEFRLLHEDPPTATWKAEDVAHPVGTMIGWSWVYGVMYLAAALILFYLEAIRETVDRVPPDWLVAPTLHAIVVATLTAIGLALVLAIPFLAPRRYWRQHQAALTKDRRRKQATETRIEGSSLDAFVDDLVRRGETFARYLRYDTDTDDTKKPALTPHGEAVLNAPKLASDLHRTRAVQGWRTPGRDA
jgi:patatin-related protein